MAEAWAQGLLSPAERSLWQRMSGPDRRHAVVVARRVEEGMAVAGHRPPGAGRELLVAALLHDVGKVEAGLGTLGRVGATLTGFGLGWARVREWADRPGNGYGGLASRIGRYLAHDRLGAELLRRAGSRDVVVTWAAQHHLPPGRWEVPPEVGRLLKAADDV